MLTVYSKNNCPNCDKAKQTLQRNGVKFKTVMIDGDNDARQFLIEAGHKSVPQFYDGNMYVGDYDSFIKPFVLKK